MAGGSDVQVPALKLATTNELFDTKFKAPETFDVAAGRWEVNFPRFGLNYLLLVTVLWYILGIQKAVWVGGPLILAHATLKTRTIKSKVAKFFKSM
eukprot:m.455984 g.455984  ORF g.455984 m.455984 type:complete len:96 (-) comp20969_c0_seq1:226-513(-)